MPSTFSWNCKNSVNTSIFCDQLAKNAVIYSVFLLGFQKHWYLRCFVHLRFKKYWYLQHFLLFFIAPAKDVKTLTAFCPFRKAKNRPKKVSKRHFFSILGTLKTGGGGNALGDAYERPGFRPKSSPPPSWRIFGLTPLVGSAGPLGPPFHRSVGVKVTEWGPASEIYSLGFLERICWNRRFFGEQVSSRKLLRRVFPKELLPISTCYFV